MNRQILFKAKRKDNGKWVEGYYCKTTIGNDVRPSDVIFVPFKVSRNEEWGWMKVDSDTICQYTGLTDKNGKKIWENDIVSDRERLWQVHYYKHFAMYMLKGINHNGGSNGMNTNLTECKVVGNIFDNADLLEVEEC